MYFKLLIPTKWQFPIVGSWYSLHLFIYFLLTVFAQCGDCEEALKSFEKSGDWRQVFPLSAQLQYSQPDTAALARRIASTYATS